MWDPYVITYLVTTNKLAHGDGEQDAAAGCSEEVAGEWPRRPCRGRIAPGRAMPRWQPRAAAEWHGRQCLAWNRADSGEAESRQGVVGEGAPVLMDAPPEEADGAGCTVVEGRAVAAGRTGNKAEEKSSGEESRGQQK